MSTKSVGILAAIAFVLVVGSGLAAVRYMLKASSLELELENSASRIRGLEQALAVKPQVVKTTEVLPERGSDAELDQLKSDLATASEESARLRAQLALQGAPRPDAQPRPASTNAAAERQSEGPERGRGDRGSFMERLKETDPKRYEEIKEARKKAAEAVSGNIGARFQFFADLDVSGLSPEQRAVHEQVLARLAAMNEVVGKIGAETGDMHRAEHVVFESMQDLRPLLETERQILLYDAALRAGYEGQAAKDYVDYLEYINEVTSPRGIFRGMWGGGPGGGGPAGRSPGGGPPGR